ncbi:NAD(P)/FAD-dependent oxidoreductase [Cryobacterium sp. N21]|uniref:NAD(P)/FAD-dependent oxidoreductase n=1 Tax=Cryobacterium sp. N21 TaxID=2048289 RepID=UPI000CE519BF|nr:FAD-dependent oxidoreductase [Cryobacterium sp. N21]
MNSTEPSRTSAGTLVIGAGQAGLQLASSMRELGYSRPITVIGGEAHPPYQRPPLSKAFLNSTVTVDELSLRSAEYYTENDISIVSGEWVEKVVLDETNGSAGEATTRSGHTFPFERIAFTVGGTPRRMHVPGAELSGIHYLRTVDDALALKTDLEGAAHIVVVGGGFVGLEIAASATAQGKKVTVLEAQDRLMARVVAPVMSGFYANAHRRRGTEIVLDAAVTGFRGNDRVSGVTLANERVIDADMVVVGIGLIPHTKLATALGIATERGIDVDAYGRTRIPGIVAAGDCANSAHPIHGAVRLESVPNAIAQAKTAAAALLGLEPGNPAVPWFWSDQADLKLQMAGLSISYDQVVVRGEPDSEQFSALYYREGQLISIEAVNSPADYMAARRILESGGNIPIDTAGDTRIPLKTHFVI